MNNSNNELRKLQAIELEMMDYLHNFCEKYKIHYYIAYGSCLGAIRHCGFIPWDDDIDVVIPFEEYRTLLKVFNDENKNSKYRIISSDTSADYPYAFAKMINTKTILKESDVEGEALGVYIDLFPLYGLPKSKILVWLKCAQFKYYEVWLSCARKNNTRGKNAFKSLAQSLISPLAKKIGTGYFLKRIHKIARNSYKENSNIVSVLPPNYSMKREVMESTIFEKRELVKFEDRFFYIPHDYDKYLTQMYGDYMRLPPVENRITHHNYSIEFLED